MTSWQQQLKEAVSDSLSVAHRFNLDPGMVDRVAHQYPVQLTPYLLQQMSGTDHPFWRQFVPDAAELEDDGLPTDPLAEHEKSPTPAIVHRYPQRVLLLAANSCAAYCRFCTRKRRVGDREYKVSFGEILDGIAYIAERKEINEVIISGGDPLILSDGLLGELLDRLRKIEHVEILRIATRMPAVLPQRFTQALADLLSRYQPLYLTTHFNHPQELTPEAIEACRLLADAGIPLANQTVLLKGVNDDLDTLADLCRQLLRHRVRPYYLHQMDPVAGTGHFRVPLQQGVELIDGLRSRVSGLAVPHYIIDSPGGHGKVELVAENVVARNDENWTLRAPDGSTISVPA